MKSSNYYGPRELVAPAGLAAVLFSGRRSLYWTSTKVVMPPGESPPPLVTSISAL